MRVLARAFGDQPLDREAVGATARVTFVAARDALAAAADTDPIGVGFPNQFVFAFDDRLFSALQAAWEARDLSGLTALWAEATPLSSALA